MQSVDKENRICGEKSVPRMALGFAPALGLLLLLALFAIVALAGPRTAYAGDVTPFEELVVTPTLTMVANVTNTVVVMPHSITATATALGFTPVPASPSSTSVPASPGWEGEALRDFAEVMFWPPVVTRDTNGRFSVQRPISGTEWSLAAIRSFDSRAGAEAAFAASQEDARLSGYTVSSEVFNQYPAYFAQLRVGTGAPLERRFYWLADSWVLGVEVRGTGPIASAYSPRVIGRQLLNIALQYGLPSAQVTPTPTDTPVAPRTPSASPVQGGGGTPGSPRTPSPTATSTPTSPPRPSPTLSEDVPSPTPTVVLCGVSFYDVAPEMWAYRYISQLACEGVVSGYRDGAFRPQHSTSRAQLAKMVALSEGWSLLSPAEPTFSDVGRGHTFFRYVETAYARGVVSGFDDGTFHPDSSVTRAQVAKMIVLARRWPLQVAARVDLCDVEADHWASNYIQVAIRHGIFTGYGNGCFHPDAPATRAQLAKVLVLAYR